MKKLFICLLYLGISSCTDSNNIEDSSVSYINTGRYYKVSECIPEGLVYCSTTKPYKYYVLVKDKNNQIFYFYLTKEQQKDFENNN